jgi:predicted nucleotidyltransferase
MNITKNNINKIKLLYKNNIVKYLFAFGSVTREDFKESSDIDFIVDINEKNLYFYLFFRC